MTSLYCYAAFKTRKRKQLTDYKLIIDNIDNRFVVLRHFSVNRSFYCEILEVTLVWVSNLWCLPVLLCVIKLSRYRTDHRHDVTARHWTAATTRTEPEPNQGHTRPSRDPKQLTAACSFYFRLWTRDYGERTGTLERTAARCCPLCRHGGNNPLLLWVLNI